MCRFCWEDRSFEETAILGKAKLRRCGRAGACPGAGGMRERPALVPPCCPRPCRRTVPGWPGVTTRKATRSGTGKASRGVIAYGGYRDPSPRVSSMAHGSPGFSPTSRGAARLLSCLYIEYLICINYKIHLVASRSSSFCPKILCKLGRSVQRDQKDK